MGAQPRHPERTPRRRPKPTRKLRMETLEDRCPTGGLPLTPLQPFNGWGLPDGAFAPRTAPPTPSGATVGTAPAPTRAPDPGPAAGRAVRAAKALPTSASAPATGPGVRAARPAGGLDVADLSVDPAVARPPASAGPATPPAATGGGGSGGPAGSFVPTPPPGAPAGGTAAPAGRPADEVPGPAPDSRGTDAKATPEARPTPVRARSGATPVSPTTPPAVTPATPAPATPLATAPGGHPAPSAPPPPAAPARRSGTARIGFNHTDLGGWDVQVEGGTEAGKGSVRVGSALLEEGDSFTVGIKEAFVVPENPAPLTFTYTDLSFDTTDPDSINDAFEAALVGPDGRPLVHTHAAGRDSFLNVTEGVGGALGAGTTEAGGAVRTVTVDMGGVAPGTLATIRFRLVNNDSDTQTQVRILDVVVPTDNEPPMANAGTTATDEDVPAEVDLRTLAIDHETAPDALVFAVGGAEHGAVELLADGHTARFTPATDYFGPAAFTYTVTDAGTPPLSAGPAAVAVTVRAVNDAPVVRPGSAATDEDTPVLVDLLPLTSDVDDPAGPWTFTVDGAVNGAVELLPDGHTAKFIPAPDYSGAAGFTFRASDGRLASAPAAVAVTVGPVNDAPVVRPAAVATDEDTPVLVDLVPQTSDVDHPAGPWTFTVGGAVNGTVELLADGHTARFTPAPDYFGTGAGFIVRASDGELDSAPAAVAVTVRAVNDAPAVATGGPAPARQYSDPVAPVTVTAADLDDTGAAVTAAITSALPPGLDLTLTDAGATAGGPFPGGPAGTHAWTLGGTARVAPGTYPVTVTVSDGRASTSTQVSVVVAPEDARATYTGPLFASTASAATATATVTLRATIQDVSAVDPAADPYPGDIRKATVTFVNRDTGAVIAGGLPVTLVDPNDPTTGVASFDWAVNLGNADALSATVGIVVGGWYARNNTADDTLVTVSRPLDLFITGGGYLVNELSAGTYAGDAGARTNFGFNVKFNPSRTNLQGKVTVIARRAGHVYQIKSTNLQSLAAPAGGQGAVLVAKANLTDVTDPALPVSLGGNLTLQMTLTDRGEPGSADSISFTLWDGSALRYSSRWTGAQTDEQVLVGGNLVVHTGGQPLRAAGAAGGGAAPALTAGELAPVAAEAVRRWAATGLAPAEAARLGAVKVVVGDLPAGLLGLAADGVVRVDVDADGRGWFADPTPADDSEFAPAAAAAVRDRVDLLTVVAHELGHLLGHDDHDPVNHSGDLMAAELPAGVRRLPAADGASAPAVAGWTKFYVADAGGAVYGYGPDGAGRGDAKLAPTPAIRGVASTAAGDTLWVVDGHTRAVTVLRPDGTPLGGWAAGGVTSPQGVATDGTDVWLADAGAGVVARYAGAAARRDGLADPAATFRLHAANGRPSDLATDGATVWVTDEGAAAVFVYDVAGGFLGRWALDPANADPSGLTLDPSGASPDLWVVDRADRVVYRYAGARAWTDGTRTAADRFALAAGNAQPEGIADPPPAGGVIELSFDSLPSTQGWQYQAFNNSAPESQVYSVTGTSLVQDSMGVGFQGQGSNSYRLPGAVDPTLPFTIQVRARVTQEEGDVTNNSAGFFFGAFLGTETDYVGVGRTRIEVNGEAVPIPFDGTSLHDYRLEGWPGRGYELYIDGILVSAGPARPLVFQNELRLGDSTGGTNARAEVTHYRFTQPSVRVTVEAAAGGDRAPAGARRLLSGAARTVRNDGQELRDIVAVAVNGVPVEALDATGNFFTGVTVATGRNQYVVTATDSVGMTGTTTVSVEGNSTDPAFSNLSDVSGSLTAEYGRTSFDAAASALYAGLAVRNTGTYPVDAPLYAAVRNISDPAVRVRGADGTTPDGLPYFDLSSLVAGGTLAPGQATGSRPIAFFNPTGERFTYELVFLARLNPAPAVTTVPGVEAVAGRPYQYDVDATDPDGDALAYSLEVAPTGMTIDPATGVITWAPAPTDIGIHSVVVRVEDGRGGSTQQRYALSAVTPPPNRPPVVRSVPVVTATAGAAYSYQALANDPDGDALTYFLGEAVTRPVAVANPSFEAQPLGDDGWIGGTLTGWSMTGGTDAGPFNPSSARYPSGSVADGQNVAYSNGPTISQTLTETLAPGTRYTLEAAVGDRLDTNLPAFAVQLWAGGTLLATGSSPLPANGAFATVAAAFDAPAGHPALGRPLEIRLTSGGSQVNFDHVRLTATSTAGVPPGMTIDPSTGLVRWAPGDAHVGDHEVRVQVADGRGGVARQTFAVRVGSDPDNGAPVILSQPTTQFEIQRTAGPQVTGGAIETGSPTLGSIRGQKFLDIDGDGVRDVNGEVGSLVTLAPIGPVILGPNDDGSTGLNPFGFTFNFFGQNYDQFYINNNGNITFTTPNGGYSASGFPTGLPIIAPFWADVDTRGGGGVVHLARGTSARNNPFVQVDWPDVGYYPAAVDKLNDFTLYIEDDPAGDVVAFFFRNMEWTTGSASGGSGGFGGTPAQIGFDAGDGVHYRSMGRPYSPETLAPLNNTSFVFQIDPTGTPRPFAEPGLDGWAVQLVDPASGRVVATRVTQSLDLDGDGRIDPATEQGVYRFEDLPAGTYLVREEGQPGWNQTFPAGRLHTVPVAAGTRAEGLDFGNARTYFYPVAAVDPDGDPLTYRLEAGPAGATVDPATGALSWFPTGPGTYPFRVAVEDGRGGRAAQEFSLAVQDPNPNAPPAFISTAPTRTGPGHRYRYAAVARDPNGDQLVYSLAAAPAGMTVHPLTGEIVWAPTEAQLGTHTVRVRAQDGRGGDATQEFAVTASAGYVNQPPGFTSTAPAAATASRLYRYQPTVVDPDGDVLTYELLVGPSGMNVDPRFGTVVWVPAREQVGVHTVILRVRDADGAFATQTFDVTAGAPNGGPVITSTPPAAAAAGQPYRYQLRAQDPEGDALSYRLDLAPPGMSLDPIQRGLVEWEPGPGQVGTHSVVLTVADAGGSETAQSFQIVVRQTAENTAPVITSTPRSAASLGATYRYQATVSDPDPDPLTFELLTAPAGMTVGPDGLVTWVPGPAATGPNPVVLRVSDGRGGVAEQSFSVAVTAQPVNGPPAVTSTPPAAVVLGRTYRYDARGADPDGDPLVWALDRAPAGMSVDPLTGAVRWAPSPDQLGTHEVVLVAVDGQGGTATQAFDVDVRAVNTPPAVASTPPTQAAVGRAYGYAVRAADPDGDPLTFSVAGPANMAIDPATGVLTWTPTAAQVGVHGITVIVSDGQAVATQSFDVQVLGTAANLPPAITSAPAGRAVVGSPYEYRVVGTDPDGQALTYSLPARPDGMAIDPATGVVAWTPAPAQAGTFPVTIRATDPAGAYAEQSFSVVAAANLPPAIARTPAPPAAVTVGRTDRYDVRAADPEGQPLAYTLPAAPAGMTVDALGRLAWTPTAGQVGPQAVTVRVADPLGAADTFTFTVAVATDTTAPLVGLQVSQNPAPVGSPVTVLVTATDDVAVASLALTANGVPVALDPAGRATVPAAVVGDLVLVATGRDAAGNAGTRSLTVTVFDPTDVDGPAVDLTGPAEDAVLTAPTDVTGSVTDENLLYYTLSVAPVGSDAFVEFARGTAPVVNGVLGRLDPSVLANDSYVLRLFANDVGGHEATVDRLVSVAGDLKLGNFTLSFTDLTVPVSGVPITVTRTYDSFRSGRAGDLGYGWRLEFRDAELRTSVAPTGMEEMGIYNGFRSGDRVYVTLPGGKREGFTFRPVRAPGLRGSFLGIHDPKFVPDAGVTGALAAPPADLVATADGTWAAFGGFPYHPLSPLFGGRVEVATAGGLTYLLDGETGRVARVTDPHGNTLTFTADAVESSAGPRVAFERDALGRIAALVDPAGHRVEYRYDARGDLAEVVDRTQASTKFEYRTDRPHYLAKVIDPLGRPGLRSEYDEQGRLVRTIDAAGQVVELVHDPEHSIEVVKDQLGNPTTYEYDARGNVVREVNPEGEVVRRTYDLHNNVLTETEVLANGTELTTGYTYDAAGNRLTETDPLGNVTRTTYQTITSRSALGVPLPPTFLERTVTDPLGNTTTNEYDPSGNLLSTTDPAGTETAFAYDGNGNPTSLTTGGGTTAFAYDGAGRVTRQTDAGGRVTEYAYDPNGNRLTETTTLTTPAGVRTLVTRFEYDASGRVSKVTDAEGGVTRTEYNAAGQKAATVDARERRTEYRYDDRGQLTETIYPDATPLDPTDNPRTKTEYDAAGREVARVDERNRVTRLEYDDAGRLVKTIYPDATPLDPDDNPRTETEYDDAGRATARVDERGNRTEFEYDAAGRQIVVRDALLKETHFGYDAAGRRIAQTDPLDHTTRFEHDAAGRVVRTTFHDGTDTEAGYNLLGRLVTRTDPNDHATTYEYDDAGRLTAVVDPLLRRTEYRYDEAGNLIRQEDANDHVTTYEYDGLGRRTATVLPEGQRASTEYDLAGQVERAVDFNGRAVAFEYDARGRLTARRFEDGTAVEFTYTPAGERATATDARGTTHWDYDDRGRLLTRTEPDGVAIAYTYDAAGNRTSLTTAAGTVAYHFDARNRLDKVTDPAGGETAYQYDAAGRQVRADLPNGTSERREYNALNRLTFLENLGPTGVISSYRYDLDAAGHRTMVEEDTGRTVEYAYDPLDRLTEEKITDALAGNRTIGYAYDPVGNRLTRADTAEGTTAYVYDSNDRLLTETTGGQVTGYTYDANGNTLTKSGPGGNVGYAWDDESQLVGADTDGNGTVDVANRYDADGIRVSQTVGTEETGYLIDQVQPYQQVALEYRPSGVVVVSYVRGNDLVLQDRGGARSYLHKDGLGSTRALTSAVGAVTDRYVYEAFGRTIGRTGNSPNVYMFAGEQRDAVTGLDYLRARYLHPAVGRFMSRDPLDGLPRRPMTLHRFIYGNANPVNVVDPSGLFGLAGIATAFSMIDTLSSLPSANFGSLSSIGLYEVKGSGFSVSPKYISTGGRFLVDFLFLPKVMAVLSVAQSLGISLQVESAFRPDGGVPGARETPSGYTSNHNAGHALDLSLKYGRMTEYSQDELYTLQDHPEAADPIVHEFVFNLVQETGLFWGGDGIRDPIHFDDRLNPNGKGKAPSQAWLSRRDPLQREWLTRYAQ